MTISFRPAGIKDVPAIVSLVNAAYRGATSKLGWTTEAALLGGQRTDEDEIKALIEAPDSIILVCLKNEVIIASAHLQKSSEGAKLGMLAVYPTLQREGLGRQFIEHVEDVAQHQWGAKKIQMTVITLRTELIAYYERRGYRRTGIVSDFPSGENFGIPKVAGLALETLEKNIDTKVSQF